MFVAASLQNRCRQVLSICEVPQKNKVKYKVDLKKSKKKKVKYKGLIE